ncbi:MAG: SGNH/GDSL hydrolase family protein [Kiritimatiellae bacterium]|nr:SGNH/GDSL hydrolase family protein [Kiritimatiellia bacterium]
MNTSAQNENSPGGPAPHKRKAGWLVAGVLLAAGLALDFVSSTIKPSATEYMLHMIQAPIGHVPKRDFQCYFGVRFWDEFKNPVAFNNLGFRNDIPFNSETTAGKRILFTLGDSTTACLEVPLAQSYPAVLGAALGPDWVVFNAGVRAYDTQQVIINYLTRVRPLKPEAVVYLICANDYNNNVALDSRSDYVRYFGKGIINDRLEVDYVAPVVPRLQANDRFNMLFKIHFNLTSLIVRRLAALFSGWRGAGAPQPPHYYTLDTLRKMHNLLEWFDAETARDGVKLYLAFMPEFEADPGTARASEMYRVYKATREFSEANLTNTVFIPTFDMFLEQAAGRPGRPRFTLVRDPHANEHGNRWLGETIAAGIRAGAR